MADLVILFCDKCGLRISQSDLDTGKARKTEETRALCAQCASGEGARSRPPLRDSKPGLKLATRQTAGPTPERKTGPAVRDSKLGLAPATREAGATARLAKGHPSAPIAEPSTSRNLIFGGVGVVAVFGVLLAVLLSGKPGAAPREKAKPTAAESAPVPRPGAPVPEAGQASPSRTVQPPGRWPDETSPREIGKEGARTPASEAYDPRASVAASLLLQAKQYLAARPDDPWGYRDKLDQLKAGYARTPAADEAARLLADLKLPEKPAPPPEDPAASAEAVTLDRLDYADDQAAQAAWRPVENSAPVAVAEVEGLRAVRFPCRFKGTKGGRGCWDHSLTLDLTAARGLQFRFHCRDIRPISGFTVYLKSGNGWYKWYRRLPEPGGGWSTLRVEKSEAGTEGTPAGWGRIEAIRLSAWRGADEDTEFCVTELARIGGAPPAPPAPVVAAESVATAAPADPAQAAQAEYARFLAGLQALLGQKAWPLARARLEDAAKDPRLAASADALKLDGECAALAEQAQQAVAKGAAALTDGRAFVLEQTDGKRLAVGEGSKNSVRKVEGDALQIEQGIGGGKLTMNLALPKLKAETRQELARLGLPEGGEGKLALALMRFPLPTGKDAGPAEKEMRTLLAQAEKDPRPAPAEKVARVRAWLDAAQREEAAARAFQEMEGLIEAKQGEAAAAALKGFRKEYAGTAFGLEAAGRLQELEAALKKLLPR